MAHELFIKIKNGETVNEHLMSLLGIDDEDLVPEPRLEWTPLDAAQPDDEFVSRLVTLLGAPAAVNLINATISPEHEVVSYVIGVGKPFFYDADPERAATKIADEAHKAIYSVVLQRLTGEEPEDDDG